MDSGWIADVEHSFGAVMEEWEVRDAMASVSGQRAGLMAH